MPSASSALFTVTVAAALLVGPIAPRVASAADDFFVQVSPDPIGVNPFLAIGKSGTVDGSRGSGRGGGRRSGQLGGGSIAPIPDWLYRGGH